MAAANASLTPQRGRTATVASYRPSVAVAAVAVSLARAALPGMRSPGSLVRKSLIHNMLDHVQDVWSAKIDGE